MMLAFTAMAVKLGDIDIGERLAVFAFPLNEGILFRIAAQQAVDIGCTTVAGLGDEREVRGVGTEWSPVP